MCTLCKYVCMYVCMYICTCNICTYEVCTSRPENRSRVESMRLDIIDNDPDCIAAASFMKNNRKLTASVSLAAVSTDSSIQ